VIEWRHSAAVHESGSGTFRTCGHVGYQVLSGHRRGWFDMRDLGAVFDHEEPLPDPACDQVQ
jgi:hypothetical protein